MDESDLNFDLLAELADAHGPPGREGDARDVAARALEAVTDRVTRDAMGNVVGTVEGGDLSVLVAAHVDEIGFVVRHVTDDGFLRLDAIGGWNPEVLRAQRVVVHTDSGPVRGFIGAIPAHTRDEESEQAVNNVAVDLGRDAEAVSDLVNVGDVVTMDQEARRVGDVVTGKALDDRAGVFAAVEAARAADPEATVHVAATVQEELGLRGARALGVDVDPDIALAVDGTLERAVPGVDDADSVTRQGDGVAIKRKDATVIPTPSVADRLEALAEGRGVPFQREVAANIGTDTGALQVAGGGRPVGALSIPVRYHHSVTESAHVADLRATVDLLAATLSAVDGSWVDGNPGPS